MVIWDQLYYNVNVSETGSTSQKMKQQYEVQKFHFVTKSWKICKKTIDNFPYPKYNDLVMQLGISKIFQKEKKGECINYEKAD